MLSLLYKISSKSQIFRKFRGLTSPTRKKFYLAMLYTLESSLNILSSSEIYKGLKPSNLLDWSVPEENFHFFLNFPSSTEKN